jgi:hypothetical protein
VLQENANYNFQFCAGNCPRDSSLGIVVNPCNKTIASGTPFRLITFSSWTSDIESWHYEAKQASTPGNPCYLSYISGPTLTTQALLCGAVHSGITCDGCGVFPLSGVRFKCSECFDYNLCSDCEDKNIETKNHHANHALLKIKVPIVIHVGVSCDDCGVSPIEGIRYTCQVCDNYDLCEKCEAKNQHPPTHILLKAKQPLNRYSDSLSHHRHHPDGSNSNIKSVCPFLRRQAQQASSTTPNESNKTTPIIPQQQKWE